MRPSTAKHIEDCIEHTLLESMTILDPAFSAITSSKDESSRKVVMVIEYYGLTASSALDSAERVDQSFLSCLYILCHKT